MTMVYITQYSYENTCDLMHFLSFCRFRHARPEELGYEMRYYGLVDNEDE